MTDLPAPLVAAEVDLRDYDYMPLFGKRLFSSDTWVLCDGDEKVAALRLWWASWHQEPAGSLPQNDKLLADFAGYGVAVSAFQKVKANAMRGWIACSDGRLYHPVVASIALDVWRTKRKKTTENEADRERQRRKRAALSAGQASSRPPDNSDVSTGQSDGHPPENGLKGSRREVERDSEREGQSGAGAPPPSSTGLALIDDDPLDIPLALDRTPAGQAVRAWNALAQSHNLPQIAKLTKQRRVMLAARLRDAGGIHGIEAALERVAASPFCLGQNDRGWRANIDWFLSERGFTRLMEGHFEPRANGSQPDFDAFDREVDRRLGMAQ